MFSSQRFGFVSEKFFVKVGTWKVELSHRPTVSLSHFLPSAVSWETILFEPRASMEGDNPCILSLPARVWWAVRLPVS